MSSLLAFPASGLARSFVEYISMDGSQSGWTLWLAILTKQLPHALIPIWIRVRFTLSFEVLISFWIANVSFLAEWSCILSLRHSRRSITRHVWLSNTWNCFSRCHTSLSYGLSSGLSRSFLENGWSAIWINVTANDTGCGTSLFGWSDCLYTTFSRPTRPLSGFDFSFESFRIYTLVL